MIETALIGLAGSYILGGAGYAGMLLKNKAKIKKGLVDTTTPIGNLTSTFRENFNQEKIECNDFFISKNFRMNKWEAQSHVLCIGITGWGKSRRVVMHNVSQLKNCSIVVTDPSREIERNCTNTQKKLFFCPTRPNDSVGFDPIRNCKNTLEVKQNIETLLINSALCTDSSPDMKWVMMGMPLIKSYAVCNYYTKRYDFSTFVTKLLCTPVLKEYRLFLEFDEENKTKSQRKIEINSIEQEIVECGSDEAFFEFEQFKEVMKAEPTWVGIQTNLKSCLNIFTEENVAKICQQPTFDFARLKKEEICFYIQVPTKSEKHYSPITATLMEIMLNDLTDENSLFDKDIVPVKFILDEFANIGKLKIIEYLTTVRKFNINFFCFIQNIDQLKKTYGNEADALWQSFGTKLIMGGLLDDAEKISNLIGTEKVYENNKLIEKKVMTQSDVRMLAEDEVIIIQTNKPIRKDKMMDKYKGDVDDEIFVQ